MIQVIDLRAYNEIDGRFAFFNIFDGVFTTVLHKSVWKTFYEFEVDVKNGWYVMDCSLLLDDYRKACPAWVFSEKVE